MLRLSHTVTLQPVPRSWVEAAVRAAYDGAGRLTAEDGVLLADGRPVPDVRVTAGRRVAAGARYRLAEDGAVTLVAVEAWGRSAATRLRLERTEAGTRTRAEAELRSVDRPEAVRFSAELRDDGGRYRRGKATGSLDLRRWWQAGEERPEAPADGGRRTPPLAVEVRHPLARVRVRVGMRPAKDGSWQVTCDARVRGRGWARPPAAVAALFVGFAARRAYRRAVEKFALRWNEELPAVLAHDPEEAVAGFFARLAEG